MSVINNERVKLHSATAISGTGTSTSTWYPAEGAEYALWVDVDSAGTPAVKIELLESPFDYYTMNKLATLTTEYYRAVTIAASHSATALTKYDAADVDDLARPKTSVAVKLTGVSGDDCTVDVTLEWWK